jgi:UDP-N-acetyl-D-glucosamine dehydrogenase
VRYHDPYVARFEENGHQMASVPLTEAELKASDCVIVVTDHTSVDYAMVKRCAPAVVDTRHVMPR